MPNQFKKLEFSLPKSFPLDFVAQTSKFFVNNIIILNNEWIFKVLILQMTMWLLEKNAKITNEDCIFSHAFQVRMKSSRVGRLVRFLPPLPYGQMQKKWPYKAQGLNKKETKPATIKILLSKGHSSFYG